MPRKYSSFHYLTTVPRAIWSHPANQGHRLRAISRAVGWQVYKRVIRRPLDIRFHDGLRARCYPDSAYASNLIYFNGQPEPTEFQFLHRYLRPGDGFIDGGANIGAHTLLAASLVGPTGHVEAFEANPEIAERLRENIQLNGFRQVAVHAEALADRRGVVSFTAGRDVSGTIMPKARWKESIQVPAVPLAAAVRPWPYAMAKLDVEGAERLVLEGALPMLAARNPPVWQVEVLPQYRELGLEIMALMRGYGYELATYDGTALDFVPHESPGRIVNLWFVAAAARQAVEARLRS